MKSLTNARWFNNFEYDVTCDDRPGLYCLQR